MQAFFKWWLAQLASMMPEGSLGTSAGSSDASILEIDRDTVRLLVRTRGALKRLAESSANEAGFRELGLVMGAARNLPQQLLFHLPAAQVLQKRVALPVAARDGLEEVLGFEIDRETPFGRDEVYWTYRVPRHDGATGQVSVDLVIVPRCFLDPLLRVARAAGLKPVGVEVVTAEGAATLIRLDVPQPPRWLPSHRPVVPLAGAAAALALVAVAAPFVIQQWALASADATIASLGSAAQEAAALRQSADQRSKTIEFLNQKRQHNGSATATLAAVTRALPDDTYLNVFTLRDGRLTLSGASPSAAQLIGVLAQSPEFREPAFEAPVVQNGEGDLENFTISVGLKSGDVR